MPWERERERGKKGDRVEKTGESGLFCWSQLIVFCLFDWTNNWVHSSHSILFLEKGTN
jgi:hypothetical protein